MAPDPRRPTDHAHLEVPQEKNKVAPTMEELRATLRREREEKEELLRRLDLAELQAKLRQEREEKEELLQRLKAFEDAQMGTATGGGREGHMNNGESSNAVVKASKKRKERVDDAAAAEAPSNLAKAARQSHRSTATIQTPIPLDPDQPRDLQTINTAFRVALSFYCLASEDARLGPALKIIQEDAQRDERVREVLVAVLRQKANGKQWEAWRGFVKGARRVVRLEEMVEKRTEARGKGKGKGKGTERVENGGKNQPLNGGKMVVLSD